MKKFRKKPVVVEAVQRDAHNTNEIRDWISMGGGGTTVSSDRLGKLGIYTGEGIMWASTGDWIIRGVQGEFYPCKPDIFEATYEALDEPGCICYPGHHDMPGGREPACPA